MMYKAFAALTLVAAPIVVLVVQSIVPQPAQIAPSAPTFVAPAAPAAPAAPSIPSVAQPPMPAASLPDPASFGQPMPDAGKPMLAPGNGLPAGAPAAPQPVGGGDEDPVEPVAE